MLKTIAAFNGPYRFLSNFWPAPVLLDGVEYPTVEHAYQAAKTTSANVRIRICGAKTPGDAKRAGRHVILRQDWLNVRLTIMTDLVRQKFDLSPLDRWLIATGDAELIEGNTWNDTFWGVSHGRGANHLGRILMQVRAELSAR